SCDVTRVVTLQLGYAGAKWLFAWEGVNTNHHDLAHQDVSDAGVKPDVTAKLVTVNRWVATQVATLARRLAAIPEGDGSLLDHTLIVWGNELARGDHRLENIPVAFIGSAGGAIAPGLLVDQGPQPFQRVGTTILRAMGLDAPGFGDAPDCGPLPGVLA